MAAVDLVFGVREQLAPLQECARALLIFVYGLVALRVAGRRIFARRAALDIVVAMLAGSNLSRALTGSAPLWGTLLATTLLLACHWLLARAAAFSPCMSRWIEGRATTLARDGKIDDVRRRWHGISTHDLLEALRREGLDDPAETRLILEEASGELSILKAGPGPRSERGPPAGAVRPSAETSERDAFPPS